MAVDSRPDDAAHAHSVQFTVTGDMARYGLESVEPVKANHYQSGGYEYDFVDEVPDRLTCLICAKPYRDPHLVVCCCQHYCGSCLTTSFTKKSVKSCPHCRAKGEKYKYVDHKGLKSEVHELKIYCPKRNKGCKWEGQLEHLKAHQKSENGCEYERIPCPNKCKDTVETFGGVMLTLCENKYVYRKDLKKHLTTECVNRSYRCEYCRTWDTYEAIVDFHYKLCPEHPVPCPNSRCRVRSIKRKDLDDHLKKCPEELVKCPLAEAGCSERVRRCRLDDHMTSNVQKHLTKLMGAYKELKRRVEELESNPKAKRPRLSESSGLTTIGAFLHFD